MIDELNLPECHWGAIKGIYPFFLPLCVPDGRGGTRYLTEDYSFSHRLAQIGITPMADTSIKLFHYKKYGFSYEDLQPRRAAPTTRSKSHIRKGATDLSRPRLRMSRAIQLRAGQVGASVADGRRQTVASGRMASLPGTLPRLARSTARPCRAWSLARCSRDSWRSRHLRQRDSRRRWGRAHRLRDLHARLRHRVPRPGVLQSQGLRSPTQVSPGSIAFVRGTSLPPAQKRRDRMKNRLRSYAAARRRVHFLKATSRVVRLGSMVVNELVFF